MTLAELIEDAKTRIAEGSTAFFEDSTWRRWINEAQRYVVRRTKTIERVKYTDTIPGQQDYIMDPDFWTISLVLYDNEELRPIDVKRSHFPNPSAVGTPYGYALWGRSILLYPVPSVSKQLIVFYKGWPLPLVNDDDEPEIPEAFHGLLPTFAAYRAKLADQQRSEAEILFLEFQQGLEELVEATTDKQDQVNRVRDVRGDLLWPL